MLLFDTHVHYNDEAFDEDRKEVIKKIHDAGIANTVVVGYNLKSSKEAIKIAKEYDFIFALVRNSS